MPIKIKISADDIKVLRDELRSFDLDYGCRPVARRTSSKFVVEAFTEKVEFERMGKRRSSSLLIEVLEEISPDKTRLLQQNKSNRFLSGTVLRGFGKKE